MGGSDSYPGKPPSDEPVKKSKESPDPTPDGRLIRLPDDALYRHVQLTLATARAIKGEAAIDAGTALRAALSAKRRGWPDEGRSAAMDRLAELIPIDVAAVEPTFASDDYRFTEPLATSCERAMPRKMWGREFLAYALLCKDDPSLVELAQEVGTSVAHLQDAWFEFVTESGHAPFPGSWQTLWQQAGVPLPAQRSVRAGYMAESTDTEDRLGIDDEIRAFARLVATPQTVPPLSIGLMGDWGSGKSFFMETMYRQIRDELMGQPGTCNNVAQIRFNAWHMSDANLWASMVDHIFQGIAVQISADGGKTPQQARQILHREIEAANGAVSEAEVEVEAAQDELKEARDASDKLEQTIKKHVALEVATRVALTAAADKIGWKQPLGDLDHLKQARAALVDSGQSARRVLDVTLRTTSLGSVFLWLVLSLVAAGLAIGLASLLPVEEMVKQAVQWLVGAGGVVGSLVGAVARPLLKAGKRVNAFAAQLDRGMAEGKKKLESAALAETRVQLAHAQDRLRTARARVDRLQARRRHLDPSRRLASFIEERARSEDYRSRQGVISLVRRDFEELSRRMNDWIEHPDKPPKGIKPIDRIVLYIDDLDRCAPEIVVQMLEAIHLLLALNLFVVVVAVDSRWLLRSLEVHYSELLGDHSGSDSSYRVSTPQNYLEKIFQITYAVAPMSRDGFDEYIDYLTGSAATDPDRQSARQPPPSQEQQPAQQPQGGQQPGGQQRPTGQQPPGGQQPQSGESRGSSPSPSRALLFSADEQEFLKRLHPLVNTPRSAKRIVNVYRLIKASVPYGKVDDFESAGGPYRPILLLLAILHGRPGLAEQLFRTLTECNMPGRDRTEDRHIAFYRCLKEWSDELAAELGDQAGREQRGQGPDGGYERASEALHNDELEVGDRVQSARSVKQLQYLATAVQSIAPDVTVGECETYAPNLARYSLVTGQVWHTWRRPQQGKRAAITDPD
ncbi:MAG: P-loop NTPase fold protein [Proteobacteria bacterium]|nr:P-loop NTPase fold protein [Pseudomonadota bacterium]